MEQPLGHGTASRTTYAVLITDVKKYSEQICKDEEGVVARVIEDQKLMKQVCEAHGGQVTANRGDGLKMIFPSPVEAMKAATEMQREFRAKNEAAGSKGVKLMHRMGLHFGDVMLVEDPMDDKRNVTGHAVNIAARLEPLATPGQICYSDIVHQLAHQAVKTPARSIGYQELKNIQGTVKCWMTTMVLGDYEEQANRLEVPRQAVVVVPARNAPARSSSAGKYLVPTILCVLILGAAAFAWVRFQNKTNFRDDLPIAGNQAKEKQVAAKDSAVVKPGPKKQPFKDTAKSSSSTPRQRTTRRGAATPAATVRDDPQNPETPDPGPTNDQGQGEPIIADPPPDTKGGDDSSGSGSPTGETNLNASGGSAP